MTVPCSHKKKETDGQTHSKTLNFRPATWRDKRAERCPIKQDMQ